MSKKKALEGLSKAIFHSDPGINGARFRERAAEVTTLLHGIADNIRENWREVSDSEQEKRREMVMAKRKDQPSPKTFEGACRLLSKRYDEGHKNLKTEISFTPQEMRDILVGLLEDVEGRQRSFSVSKAESALERLMMVEHGLIEALMTGPVRFAQGELEPDRYEWTGAALRNIASAVRIATEELREALNRKEE